MPTTQPAIVHVDQLLVDFGIQYGQDLRKDFVADRACTVVDAKKESDKYPVWSKADWYRSHMEKRADGAESAGSGFRVDLTNKYFADVYALHTWLTERQRSNAKNELELEKAKIKWLMGQAKLKRDLNFASTLFATGIWTANTEQTGVSGSPGANQFKQFNDSASTPIEVITNQMLAVQLSTGKMPNVIVTDPVTNNWIKHHADVVDRYKHTQTGVVTEEMLAALFNVEWIVGKAVQNTAAEGQTEVMARVFGKNMLIMHRTPEMTEEEPTAAALFAWSEFDGVTPDGAAIDSWFDKDKKATKYEAEQAFDIKLTANDLGVFLKDTVA